MLVAFILLVSSLILVDLISNGKADYVDFQDQYRVI